MLCRCQNKVAAANTSNASTAPHTKAFLLGVDDISLMILVNGYIA